MHLSIRFLAPRKKKTTDDMLTQVFGVGQKIAAASTSCMLILLESKIEQVSAYYTGTDQHEYWINWLHERMLIRRCELLTLWYPENEEA